ncbi:FAD-dependent oxidoreductase [Gordonibacter sp.]|uniref:FAD-dependent oxidoreductase n=1 Tax=Gordonibacter sp. TaxID=1968902 RepID=UPI002FCB5AAE
MGNKGMQDRRSFLKGAGVAAATAATFALAGCAPAKESSGKDSASASSTAWDEEFDVIVVGAGIAGLAAAVTVATEGDKATCLLIEKDTMPNGNSPFAFGTSIYAENAEDAKVYIDQLIGGTTPDDVIAAYCAGMTENLDWILKLGATESDLKITRPDPKVTMEYPELKNDDKIGKFSFSSKGKTATHTQKFLEGIVEQHADTITYKTSTPLESLIQDPLTKAITGVTAKGKNYKAKKGIIMCCGGFESDPDMLVTFTGVEGVYPYAGRANTGDGHRACMKVGADMWHMSGGAQFWLACRDLENTKFISTVWNWSNKQHGITVGVNGRRFYQDWDGCALPTGYAEPDSDLTRNVGYRHGLTQFGGNWAHLPLPPHAWFLFDAKGLAEGALPAETSTDPVADGWALTANTIEELAATIEVPAEELTHTVEVWNDFCAGGEDKAFYRPAESLVSLSEPPYYAMRCVPAMLNTDGGPRRSAKAEILDPDGNPIAHLYSAGEFGSIWGHLYQGAGNISECMVFGRIAARNAIANEAIA